MLASVLGPPQLRRTDVAGGNRRRIRNDCESVFFTRLRSDRAPSVSAECHNVYAPDVAATLVTAIAASALPITAARHSIGQRPCDRRRCALQL
jgi:hypothetical protein